MITFQISKPEEWSEVASYLLNHCDSRILAISGNLGVGKTSLVQTICKLQGVEERVSSPTFSLVNEYQDAIGESLYHFDFYRITDQEEAIDLGFHEYLDSGSWCFVEWPEIIEELLPEVYTKVDIELKDQQRLITIS